MMERFLHIAQAIVLGVTSYAAYEHNINPDAWKWWLVLSFGHLMAAIESKEAVTLVTNLLTLAIIFVVFGGSPEFQKEWFIRLLWVISLVISSKDACVYFREKA